jgi:diketogulonate reductase-like aldo/keto reductase
MSFAAASGAPLGAGATRMPGTGVGTQRDVRARSTAPSSASAPGTTSVRLSSQATQPMVGLGTWQAPKGQVRDAVKAALETGYVHLDCAAAYANEDEVGEALEDAFARGVATRADLFVTSKLWNDRRRPEDVRAGLLQTLKDLRLEYLDLYLIHWPVCWRRGTLMQDDADASILECWRELERCVDEGLIRSIGVSNFSRPKLEELIRDARVKPAVNQIESHPLLPNTELVRWCQSNDIAVTAYSPLAQGGAVFTDPTVTSIADKHGVTPAQVLLRWNVERGVVVIPKSVTPKRIAQNAEVFGFGLDDDDMRRMESLDANVTTTPSPWSDMGPAARRNKVLRPLLSAVLKPFFWIIKVDVQRMGRTGFISWAWSRD